MVGGVLEGKFSERVAPVIYALPDESTATALARGVHSNGTCVQPMHWTFIGSPPRTRNDPAVLRGGARKAVVATVTLRSEADDSVLTIEACLAGWAALVPTGNGAGALFAFGATSPTTPELAFNAIVTNLTVISREVDAVTGDHRIFDAAPLLHTIPWPESGSSSR